MGHSCSLRRVTLFTVWFFPWTMAVSMLLKPIPPGDGHLAWGLKWVFSLHLPLFFCRLSLCNHLEDDKGHRGEMLPYCSLTMTGVNKASIRPVLICTCTDMHLKHTDSLNRRFILEKENQPLCEEKHFCFPNFWRKN